MYKYDYLVQDYQQTGRTADFYLTISDSPAARTASVTGDQLVDLSFTTSTPMSYSVSVNGTNGSKLSPRDFL